MKINPFRLSSLSGRLFLIFVMSFIIPIIIVEILILCLFTGSQYRNLRSQSENNTELIGAYLSNYVNDINDIMNGLYRSSFLQSKTDMSSLGISERSIINADIDDTLSLTAYSRDDFGDLLFISEKEVLYFNAENYYKYLPTTGSLDSRNWYIAALEKSGRMAITPYIDPLSSDSPSGTTGFFVSRQLKNLYDPDQENVIAININTAFLDALFSELDKSTPGIVLLTNDKNELIYSAGGIDTDILSQLDSRTIRYEDQVWVKDSLTLDEFPLTVHVLLSTSHIMQETIAFVLICSILFLAAVCVAYLLFRIGNHRIKASVQSIRDVLKEMEGGNLDAGCPELKLSEFQDIGSSVNHMALKLKEKIHNEYELRLAQKNLQFSALQAQIRPHFIINTIYSFITLNQIGETELLNDCFYRFANILRYVLGKEQETTLGKELDFLESYCSLFHLRFGDRITYSILCDDELRSLKIPKLMLQPLVENAIIHGIEPSPDPCTLDISAKSYDDKIYIIIDDTGVGFSKEQLSSASSIGLSNVENRIRLWNEKTEFYIYRIDGRTVQAIIISDIL